MSKPPTTNPSTAERALDCLEALAVDKGLDALSMRDVAKRLGISLAALQYHYPVKAKLIEAFITRAVEDYVGQVRDLMASIKDGPRLPHIVRFTLGENRAAMTRDSVLSMIEGRAQHDEAAAAALHLAMQAYLELVKTVIQEDYPRLSPDDARVAAALIVALLEGAAGTFDAAESLGVDPSVLLRATLDAALAIPLRRPGAADSD